jgi:hypothetical protein
MNKIAKWVANTLQDYGILIAIGLFTILMVLEFNR